MIGQADNIQEKVVVEILIEMQKEKHHYLLQLC